MAEQIKIWAHRGASAYAPENTLEAFSLAAEQKADGIELDVQMTKDGRLVVIHDETVNRVSEKKGFVKDYTLEELQKINVNVPRKEYTDFSRIPTLEEVYEVMKPTGLTVNVELKTGVIFYEGIEEKVLACTKAMGMYERVCYSSFNHQTLVNIKALDVHVPCGILFADGWLHAAFYAKDLDVECLHPSFYNLQFPGFMEEARQAGRKVNVWTVNSERDLGNCYKKQVNAVITNDPLHAREVFNSYN